jgi:hypothetical protein
VEFNSPKIHAFGKYESAINKFGDPRFFSLKPDEHAHQKSLKRVTAMCTGRSDGPENIIFHVRRKLSFCSLTQLDEQSQLSALPKEPTTPAAAVKKNRIQPTALSLAHALLQRHLDQITADFLRSDLISITNGDEFLIAHKLRLLSGEVLYHYTNRHYGHPRVSSISYLDQDLPEGSQTCYARISLMFQFRSFWYLCLTPYKQTAADHPILRCPQVVLQENQRFLVPLTKSATRTMQVAHIVPNWDQPEEGFFVNVWAPMILRNRQVK